MVLGKLNPLTQRIKIDPYFLSYTEIHFKWIMYLNVRPEAIQLLQQITGDIGQTSKKDYWLYKHVYIYYIYYSYCQINK